MSETNTGVWTEEPGYAITAVYNGPNGYFRIAGKQKGRFFLGVTFTVSGSTGNNGTYTVTDISEHGIYTNVFVVNVPDVTVDGTIKRQMPISVAVADAIDAVVSAAAAVTAAKKALTDAKLRLAAAVDQEWPTN